ncbi:MAG: YihY/virulence factor BrkB family protein [Ilumatobacteraceae bacterium]
MPLATNPRVQKARERSHVIDVLVETFEGWRLHLSARNASLLSFWSFLSIFPLMIVATTILGFVLEGNEELQQEIIDGAFDSIPVLGEQLKNDPTSIEGSWFLLIVGLLGALWASTRAFVGLQSALDDTWEVPVDDRAKTPVLRAKALAGIAVLAITVLASLGLSTVIQGADLPGIGRLLIWTMTVVIHTAAAAFFYRFLTSADMTWRMVVSGSIFAGVLISVIQHFGTTLVGYVSENSSDTYGTFAIVLGLIAWLGALSITTLLGAEMNAALDRIRRRDQGDSSVEIEEAASSVR